MELTGLIPIIRRWGIVIVVATGVAVLVGLLLGSNADRTYEARAQLLVGPLSTDTNTMRASGDLAQTYAELATSGNLLDAVAEDVGVPRRELRTGVRATANSTTRFLVIRARSHDADTAADAANSVSRQLIELSGQDPTRPEGKLRVIDPATPPGSPVSPRLDLIVALAAMAGLLGSVTLILLFEFVGDTAESADKVEASAGVPVVAVRRRRSRLGSLEGRAADPLRLVATQAELSAPAVRCVLVTGAARGDGGATLALDLGRVWRERGRPVVVIDAGGGEVTLVAGCDGRRGLAEWVARGGNIEASRTEDGIEVVAVGEASGAEAITLEDARRLVADLAGETGLVVVHGLPATLSAATLRWAQVADVTVLVVRRFQSRRTAIVETAANLKLVGARVAFAALLDLPRSPWRRPGDADAASPPPPPVPLTRSDGARPTSAVVRVPETGDRVGASAKPKAAARRAGVGR